MIVLKAPQEKVLGALQAVSGIVERRHTLPILANVLIRKTGAQVEFTTSDLEIQVRTTVEFEGDAGNFNTSVGARKLIDILRALPADQTVSLTANQNKLTLQGGKSRFTLQTLPAEDFPLVQEAADFGPTFSVPQKTLKSLIGRELYLAKELTQKSLPEIGELFGGRDHTTVLHAVRKIGGERTKNTELNQQLHVLEQTLKG